MGFQGQRTSDDLETVFDVHLGSRNGIAACSTRAEAGPRNLK